MNPLREPLVHFLLLGGLLFGIFAIAGKAGRGAAGGEVVVTAGQIENIRLSLKRSSGVEPDGAALRRGIDDYVREEILCREARALGIDRDDSLVRMRLQQRMEFMAVSAAEIAPPTDAELEAFLAVHADSFKTSDGRAPTLAGTRTAVANAWHEEQRRRAVDASYEKMRSRYRITIQAPRDAAPGRQ